MRCARRWNLSFDEFELQDENFKTFSVDDKVLNTLRQYNIKVVRLVKKLGKFKLNTFNDISETATTTTTTTISTITSATTCI